MEVENRQCVADDDDGGGGVSQVNACYFRKHIKTTKRFST